MKKPERKSNLASTPSWALALLLSIVSLMVLFALGKVPNPIIRFDMDPREPLGYIIFDLLNAIGCFIIVRWNPKSTWYVPVIVNMMGIIAAMILPGFWTTKLWVPFAAGWIISIIASIIGYKVGSNSLSSKEKGVK